MKSLIHGLRWGGQDSGPHEIVDPGFGMERVGPP